MTRKPIGLTAPYRKPAKATWQNAALRLGEELASVGPDGYYNMNPEQWLDWALKAVKENKDERRRKGRHTAPNGQESVRRIA